jgi:hypothetical protein
MTRTVAVLGLLLALAATRSTNATLPGDPGLILLEEAPLSPSALAPCVFTPYTGGTSLMYVGGQTIEDAYFFVSPTSCGTCTEGVIQVASIEYGSRTLGDSCIYAVEVSVVGVTAGACPAPDLSVVLCPPTQVNVEVESFLAAVNVPLPTTCCVSQDAFIRIRFLDPACDDGYPHPLMYTSSSACNSCDEYFTTNIQPGIADVCTKFTRNFWYRVTSDCCQTVKTEHGTWGKVKSLYRE